MTGDELHQPSPGIGGDVWARWWPRFTAAVSFGLGVWTFHHGVQHPGGVSESTQFWAVALMFGAPAQVIALRIAAERLAGAFGGGKSSPSGGGQ